MKKAGRSAHAPPLSDREHEQAKLQPDVTIIRNYAGAHADEWGDISFAWDPARLVVAFSGDAVHEHEAALRSLVAFPDQLEVRRTTYSVARLEQMRAEAHEMALKTELGPMGSAISLGKLRMMLWAGQERFAVELSERYGDAVDITVGYLHFPDRLLLSYDGSPLHLPTPERPPVLPSDEFEVTLSKPLQVRSGHHVMSEVVLRNRGREEIVVPTNGQLLARIVDPRTGEGIGSYEGAQAVPLIRFIAPSSGAVEIPLLVGTACTVSRLGYATPPGEWAFEVFLELGGRGPFVTPLLPITVGT
jgi:hypothetical protein